jgi:ribosome biogenesis GTPase
METFPHPLILTGRVIEEQKNYFTIDTTEGVFQATRSGRLKKESEHVCTGDIVDCAVANADTHEAILNAIHPRRSFIPRPALANLDQLIVVSTLIEPSIEFEILDRFLVTAMAFGFMPLIVFNKSDLLVPDGEPELARIIAIYRAIGHECLQVSAVTGHNIDALVDRCAGKLSCLAGVSGVGKTALLQRIFPDRSFRIGSLAKATGRGSHTTTNSTLIKLPAGGYIADTPGFSFMELPDLTEESIPGLFPEIARADCNCQFGDCVHLDEPGCRIKDLVETGAMAESRYVSYVKFFTLARERRREYRQSGKKSGRSQASLRSEDEEPFRGKGTRSGSPR